MAKPTIEQLKQDIVFDAVLAQTTLKFRTTWGLFSPREIGKLRLEDTLRRTTEKADTSLTLVQC